MNQHQAAPASASRVLWGRTCTWWGFEGEQAMRAEADDDGRHFECCPACGGFLMQVKSWAEFIEPAIAHERNGHPGYVAELIEAKGYCNRTTRAKADGTIWNPVKPAAQFVFYRESEERALATYESIPNAGVRDRVREVTSQWRNETLARALEGNRYFNK